MPDLYTGLSPGNLRVPSAKIKICLFCFTCCLAYIVVDVNTGDVLAQNNSFEPWFPASLTKMMTAYLAFKAMTDGSLNKNSQIILSKYDVSQAPSKSGYRAGTILSLDTALKIMLVKSTNDIATAIGKTIAKNNAVFVAMMNDQAKKLEMSYSQIC